MRRISPEETPVSISHHKTNKTKKLINENQVLMNKFRKELSDLNQHVTLGSELEIGSFSRFADFFFDGFLIDLSIQSKLTHALKTVENFYSQVCQIVKSLTRTFSMLEEKRKALEKMHIKLIETATMDS